MKNRYKHNLKILELLSEFLEKHPELRFIQALWALNIVSNQDRFHEESFETFRKALKELEGVK